VSGTSRRATQDEFPELPPLTHPPEVAPGAASRDSRAQAKPLPEIVNAPQGIPQARHTFAEEVVVDSKFRLFRLLSAHDDELVYEALHTGTGRSVNLHMLASGLPADGPVAQRMLHGARAAARVPHLNVLSVVDSGTDDEARPFLVYEQFPSCTLAERVERDGAFDPRSAAEIMVQVLEALQMMHERGVVHRHIRAENILIEEGSSLRVKLMNFGYAVLPGKRRVVPELPRGYSRYLAPEVRRGTATTDPSIDVYAAGVLMRFLLTASESPKAEVDYRADRAIAMATASEMEERFQSAGQFLSAVLVMLPEEGHPESMVPPDPLAADLKYMHRRRERESGVTVPPTGEGYLELYPVLMMIEAIYARVGGEGWRRLLAQIPEAEQLLPAAGRAEELRAKGVPVALVGRLLAAADSVGGDADLGWLAHIGEALVERGAKRFCPGLPAQLSLSGLIDVLPILWSSLARHGEVVVIERHVDSARVAVRAQVEPCLEVSAVFAGLLRALLRSVVAQGDVSTAASQALGDPADIFVLTWA
jgi:hypothetical protein